MRIFKRRLSENEKLIKNIERYEQEEKIKQQKSKIYGQKPIKSKGREKKSAVL